MYYYLFFGDGFLCSLLLLLLYHIGDEERKRFQRVEILKIAEPCPLIDPSQVVVTQGEILVADPVLTPIGRDRFEHNFYIKGPNHLLLGWQLTYRGLNGVYFIQGNVPLRHTKPLFMS